MDQGVEAGRQRRQAAVAATGTIWSPRNSSRARSVLCLRDIATPRTPDINIVVTPVPRSSRGPVIVRVGDQERALGEEQAVQDRHGRGEGPPPVAGAAVRAGSPPGLDGVGRGSILVMQ